MSLHHLDCIFNFLVMEQFHDLRDGWQTCWSILQAKQYILTRDYLQNEGTSIELGAGFLEVGNFN